MRMLVFINGRRLEVSEGESAARVLESFDPELAEAVRAGDAYLTDATGNAVNADVALRPGAILRAARSARRRGP